MATFNSNDVVDELTQDLENTLKENCSKTNTDCNERTHSKDDISLNKEEHENDRTSQNDIKNDNDGDEMGENDSDVETISNGDNVEVDEEYMKELEEKMSEEEKEVKKNEAQELKASGNDLFKASEFQQAVSSYTQALQTCPTCFQKERAIMYSNRAACRLHLEQYEIAIKDCTKALELNPNYLKALHRRAEMYEKTDKLDEALEDYKKVVEMDPSQHTARAACMRLPEQIKERNEKMKDEMMGKLKDLGNMILKPFGMSTDNFKLQQDPNTGSYSVQFQQNK